MSQEPASAPPKQTTVEECDAPRKRSTGGYVLLLLLVLSPLLLFGAYRARFASRCTRIEQLGGSVRTGPRLIYHDLANSMRTPKAIRDACRSRFGEWAFGQLPVIYSVDLRGMKNPDDVEAAMQVARSCEHLRELTLYQSAVTDAHLARMPGGFRSLAGLKINETAVTDAGVRHLRKLPSLQMVNAQRTALTDAAVPDLAKIRRLKDLVIFDTSITSVDEIVKKNPSCHISFRFLQVTRCPTCSQRLRYCKCRKQAAR